MNEAILLIVGLALLSLLANLLLASKGRGRAEQEVSHHPSDHIITVWKECDGPAHEPAADNAGLVPRKITVEYSVAIDADSEEKLASAQAHSVAAANEAFQQQFAPLLKDQQASSGVVRIETVGGDI